jgi:hypothetical protein
MSISRFNGKKLVLNHIFSRKWRGYKTLPWNDESSPKPVSSNFRIYMID